MLETENQATNPTPNPTLSPTEEYVAAAQAAGCPPDQIRNFLKARIVLQPKQLLASAAARLCDKRCRACEADWLANRDARENCPDCGPTSVGFGGSRGSAKSHWALAQVGADDCQRYEGLKFLYLRKVGKSGSEAVEDLRRSVLHSVPHHFEAKANRIAFPNGSTIRLGHYQCEKDIDAYIGIEYDGVLTEEATQLSSRKDKDIGTCVRSSKKGWRPRRYYTTNPGNIGHGWFKSRFIVPMRDNAETSTRFIQAYPWDNRFLNPEYRAILDALTGWQRAAWRDGSWDIAAGQYFTNFRRELVVRELGPTPRHWRFWGALDYGFVHFTVFYLLAEDGDGNVWFIDEHAEMGWLPYQHAEKIHAILARQGLAAGHLETIVAGHDCFSPESDGLSISDAYRSAGLTLSYANLDRINGAAEWLRRLGTPDAIPPRPPTVFIDPRCAGLIDCLPSLQRSEIKPEDVQKVNCDEDGMGGDDYYDAGRYGLMYAFTAPAAWGANPFGARR